LAKADDVSELIFKDWRLRQGSDGRPQHFGNRASGNRILASGRGAADEKVIRLSTAGPGFARPLESGFPSIGDEDYFPNACIVYPCFKEKSGGQAG